MDKLFDEIARTLASPMPRRKALRTVVQLLGAAAVVALFPHNAFAAACGTTSGAKFVTQTPTSQDRCVNGVPSASLSKLALSSPEFSCPATCPTGKVGALSCTGGNPGNGNCTPAQPCTVIAASIECRCGATTCGANNCCCTTNGTCQSSNGGTGNCKTGFPGC